MSSRGGIIFAAVKIPREKFLENIALQLEAAALFGKIILENEPTMTKIFCRPVLAPSISCRNWLTMSMA